MMQLLNIKVDVVFKDFFGDKNSKDILESFINTVLDLKNDKIIEIEEFLDPRKMRVEVGRPTTFVDISVRTKGGERSIIEMQTYNHEGFDKRLLYYLGKDYTEQINYADDEEARRRLISWKTLPKVHVIAITDFHRGKGDHGILNADEVIETYSFRSELSPTNSHLFDHWRATIIDLTKCKDVPFHQLKTDKDKWLFLLKSASLVKEKDLESLKNTPAFRHAIERLEWLSSDPKKRKAYEASINELRDHQAVLSASREEGREEGLKEGREETTFQLVYAMTDEKISLAQISKITGLPVEHLNEIIRARPNHTPST